MGYPGWWASLRGFSKLPLSTEVGAEPSYVLESFGPAPM